MTNMPAGNPIPHLKRGISRVAENPNFGAAVVVSKDGPTGFAQKMVNLILRLYRLDMKRVGGSFASLEEARAAIARLRKTVDAV
jgi:hypothetical protein